MQTCIICTMKHVGSAEFFAHETLAGYGHHVIKAMAQLDHAEIEIMQNWPEVAEVVHQQKKIIGDAIEKNNPDLLRQVDFDGLQIFLLAVEGLWNFLQYNEHNSKQYNAQEWIWAGQLVRYNNGLKNPPEFYDKLFSGTEHKNGYDPDIDAEAIEEMAEA